MTQNPLGSGKARLRPCEASVRPWSSPVESHPAQARKRPCGAAGGRFWGRRQAWGSWQNRWGENRRPCRSLRPWQELRGTQNLSRSRQETSGIKAFFPDFSPGQAERPAVLPGTGFGGLAPLPPIIVTNKVQKEKGDDTWQNQENETRL